MRRLFFSLLAMSFVNLLLGCQHTQGVCDCDCNCDPCRYNAPWVNGGGEQRVLPDARGEVVPVAPKKIN